MSFGPKPNPAGPEPRGSIAELCAIDGHAYRVTESDGRAFYRQCEECRWSSGPHEVTASAGCSARGGHDIGPVVIDGQYRDACSRCSWVAPYLTLGSPLATRHDLQDNKRVIASAPMVKGAVA